MMFNEMNVAEPKKKRRKYIPGLASLKFDPKDYWEPFEAQRLYEDSLYPNIKQDTISFDDCILGMKEMPSNSVDLVIADPPFGLDFSGKETVYNRDEKLVVDSYKEINSDYGGFTEKWMELTQKIMKPHATAYVFSGWNHLEDVLRGARLCGLTTINHLIWKYQFGVFTKNKFVTSHYHVLMLVKDSKQYYFNKMEHYPLDVWDIKRKYKKGEPKNATTLPLEVVKKCIEFSSKPGEVVFDPFMGMATTGVAAKSVWRHYFGFEINEKMRPFINKRLSEIQLGQEYLPINEKLKEIRENTQRKYPLAYKLYLKESGESVDVKS